MATNVTEKDKALQEVIAWCDQLSTEIKRTEDVTTDRTYGKLRGLYLVYEHCQNMLGHSGTMPSEVQNPKRGREMTIDELHDYCRYLFDENHVHGVPDKWSEGYEFALSLVMFKRHEGLTDEDRKAVADWREKHWKDTK